MTYKDCPACQGSAENKRLIVCSRYFLICSECRTLWSPESTQFGSYDSEYLQARGLQINGSTIDAAKRRTFREFWNKIGDLSGPVLEVGCSTGISLRAAQDRGLDIYGLEVNKDILKFMKKDGIAQERVSVNGLKAFSGKKFAGAAFFDSFEHLAEPAGFLSELVTYLSDRAVIIIVAPNAGSLSRKIFASSWLHYTPDHWVYYTLNGLKKLFSRYNIQIVRTFYPAKHTTLEMILRHIAIHRELSGSVLLNRLKFLFPLSFHFNIGEMGLICRYNYARR